jgi:DNA-binding transcriptional regulator GbsR (MarR family)
MTTEERIKKQKQLVETIGRHLEDEGFQPTAGRVLGLLMVMDKERYTFDEIVEELNISKSSASIALKNLQIRGDIDYVTLPGDRKRYFEMKKKNQVEIIEEFETKMKEFRNLLQEIIALKADPNSPNSKFYSTLIEMFDFFFTRFEDLKKEYQRKD